MTIEQEIKAALESIDKAKALIAADPTVADTEVYKFIEAAMRDLGAALVWLYLDASGKKRKRVPRA